MTIIPPYGKCYVDDRVEKIMENIEEIA